MPRAPFNDFMNVYTGAGSLTPGVLRFNTPCRLVRERRFVSRSRPVQPVTHHVTWSGLSVNAGNWAPMAGGVFWGIYSNDVLEFQSNLGTFCQVWWTDVFNWPPRSPYRRAWVSFTN